MATEGASPRQPDRSTPYGALPPQVRLEDTVASVEPDDVPDPHAGRNVDQHSALRDD
ncbi:hypothetical protein [Nocardioides sp. SYSU DS0651]|uniref:hypothetical protein n=1 Tax=Nocardioides sp. SYSU DS0651 TaxID=3415955 RepID=UPI003F4C132E